MKKYRTYPTTVRVADLALASWMKMHGYMVCQVDKDAVYFTVDSEEKMKEFNSLKISFVNSEAVSYDSAVMTLKRMPISTVNDVDPEVVTVDGIGQSAYLMVKGEWRIIGRVLFGRFAFFVPSRDVGTFNNLQVAWVNSDLRKFDDAMMAIKSLRKQNDRI